MTSLLRTKALRDMNVVAMDRAELVETYIDRCCDFVYGYSKSAEIREVLQYSDDEGYIDAARALTKKYAEGYDNIEGLYVCKWDTYVLAHINPDSVDKTFRDADSAAALEKRIRAEGKAFCTGIVLAPVTKRMVIPVYAPVYDGHGRAIGFSGAAFYTDALSSRLGALTDSDNVNIGYSLINAETLDYIFDDDASLVGKRCEDKRILDAAEKFSSGEYSEKNFSYVTSDNVVSCYYMKNRNWMFVVREKNADVFGIVNDVRSALAVICVIITVVMVIICAVSVNKQMNPIGAIQRQIVRFKSNDFSHEHDIDIYTDRSDEIGTIAAAVAELHTVLENQYELFHDMIEAQTVGTIVIDPDENRIILMNRTACEMYGITEKNAENVTTADIRAKLSEESLEKIDGYMAEVKTGSEDVSIEAEIIPDEERKIHTLIRAKNVTLSNNDNVIIFSLMDISEQKKLEEELLILSETDFLTSICNRRSGEYRIENSIKEGTLGMFCLFDVNKFKYVNDNFGHSVGDQVLVSIAETMKKTFRTSDVLIRLGGDEFVVFAANVHDEDIGRRVLDRFMANIEKIDIAELNGHIITISLGALIMTEEDTFSNMYIKTDSLMYECKKKGGNNYVFYG